jgi:O-antigen/teichoic acid export membrane protein
VPPSLKRKLLAGGFWVVLGKLFTAASRLAATGLLARLLTQDEMGSFGLVFSFVTVGAMAAQLGLQQAVVRLVAESIGSARPGRARAAIRLAFRYCTAGNLVLAAFLLLGGGAWLALVIWDAPAIAASMVGIVLWIALWSIQVLAAESFRGFQDLRRATFYGGVITWLLVVALLGMVWLAEGQTTFERVIQIFVGCVALSLLLALIALRRRVRELPPADTLRSRELIGISLPMWVTALTAFALTQSDVWILGAFVAKKEVAIYFSATQLVTLVSMSLMLVNLVVPPFIADLYARGERKRLERILRHTATLAGFPALLALAAFMFFGVPILGLVYGPAFRDGATVLALLSLGRLVNVFTGSCGITMMMTGHQTKLMSITIMTSAVTVGACLLVVRPFGTLGVAAAVCVGTIVQNVAMWLSTRYYTGMWTHVGLPRRQDVQTLFR